MHSNCSDKKCKGEQTTVIEASEYYHIGENKLRNIIETHPNADFLIMNGNRYLINKKLFEDFLSESSVL